jgi:hypothetical protein
VSLPPAPTRLRTPLSDQGLSTLAKRARPRSRSFAQLRARTCIWLPFMPDLAGTPFRLVSPCRTVSPLWCRAPKADQASTLFPSSLNLAVRAAFHSPSFWSRPRRGLTSVHRTFSLQPQGRALNPRTPSAFCSRTPAPKGPNPCSPYPACVRTYPCMRTRSRARMHDTSPVLETSAAPLHFPCFPPCRPVSRPDARTRARPNHTT